MNKTIAINENTKKMCIKLLEQRKNEVLYLLECRSSDKIELPEYSKYVKDINSAIKDLKGLW